MNRQRLSRTDWCIFGTEAALLIAALVLMLRGYERWGIPLLLAVLLNFWLLFRTWRRWVQDGTLPPRRYGDGPPRSSDPR